MSIKKDSTTTFVSYAFDEATTFKPTESANLHSFGGASDLPLMLKQSDTSMCETAPRFKITTKCFPYQWHTIAPIASNGWALIGEVGKFIPVSKQHIASLNVIESGGLL